LRAGEEDPLDKALREIEETRPAPAAPAAEAPAAAPTSVRFRLIDVSLDTLFAVGTSTERDEELEDLQGGGHDPRKRGFTLQNVELSLMAAVDPYLTGEAHIVYAIDPLDGESIVELEEAFLTTQQLPWGLQLEAGQFFTEFGRINPQHPHQWDWQDQPVVLTRFFGPDGMRAPGARLGWLTPLPWFSELHAGVQNANGEGMVSFLSSDEAFEERPIGGRPFTDREVRSLEDLVYLLRWDNGFDLTEDLGAKAGASGLYGPNASGNDGFTYIYGADFLLKWRPRQNYHGWPFLIWQTEVIRRDYHADDAVDIGDPADPGDDVAFASGTFRDWGVTTQVLYGFAVQWAAGARYEYTGGKGPPGDARQDDPFRDDRQRVSPLIAYHPTEFSRLRLQYNYDWAKHLDGNDAHSVWLGVEFLFGAHAAHRY
jgi:hypothetical protein